jgi:hypothetical protein
MKRKVVDGGRTGIKLDKFRHSRFEIESKDLGRPVSNSLTSKSVNSIDSTYKDLSEGHEFDLDNWKHRRGWDHYFSSSFGSGFRNHGGALKDHDGSHFESGPRGYRRNDGAVYDDVCETLRMSSAIDARDLSVEVKDGTVFLKGSIRDGEMKKLAEAIIENISGVFDVRNLLTLKKI